MPKLLCKPFGAHGKVHAITPQSAGWRFAGFGLYKPPERAGQMARARGVRLLGVSEVYGFNVLDDERAAQIAALIDVAEASGAGTFGLILTVGKPCRRLLRGRAADRPRHLGVA